MTWSATGIVWVGPIFDRGGYGSVSRNYLLGLKRLGFPVRAINYGPRHEDVDPQVCREVESLLETEVGPRPVGVVHHTPDHFPDIWLQGVLGRIGCTIFETDRIPQRWVRYCNQMDEIWVPSHFNLRTFSASGVDSRKIRVIPIGVDAKFFRPIDEKFPFHGGKKFTFLYAFALSWRKAFDRLLEAYFAEFTANEQVRLVLKVYGEEHSGDGVREGILDFTARETARLGQKAPEVLVMDQPMSQGALRRLYNSCDLYISTDQANGWGMPCMEVMAMGKPAATVDWSGSTEFMNEHNSFLIRPTGRLVPVDERLARISPLHYSGHRWAEVTVGEVRRVMRLAYKNPQLLERLAQAGRSDVQGSFSVEKIAEKMIEVVSSIGPASRGLRPNGPVRVSIRTGSAQTLWVRIVRKAAQVLGRSMAAVRNSKRAVRGFLQRFIRPRTLRRRDCWQHGDDFGL